MALKDWSGYMPQLLAAFAATVSSVSDGIHYGWASPVLPKLNQGDSPITVSMTEKEWLELLYMIGGIAGLPLTMYSVDKFGRKKSILLAATNNLIAWLLIAFATNVEMLLIARFLAGVGADVAFVSVPMYLAEMADKKIRGLLIALIYIMLLVGVIICYSVAPFVSIFVSSMVGGGFVLTQLLVMPWMPETPYYYLMKKKYDKAEQSLKWFRRRDNVEKELEEIKAAVERQSSESGRFIDLILVKGNRRALIIMTALNAAQHFSSLGVLLMNLHSILADADGIIETNTAAIIFSVIMFVSTIIAASIIDKCGRKVLLIVSSLLSAVALGALAVYLTFKHKYVDFDIAAYNWVPVAAVFLYAGAFRIGLGSVPIVMTGELFSASIKAKGMTLSDAMYVIFGTLVIYMYQTLEIHVGIYVSFYIFSVSCVITAFFTIFFIPETKGKTLEQIQFILKGEAPDDDDKKKRNGVI